MPTRFAITTAALLGSLSMGTAASASYIQLTDGATIHAGTGNTFIGAFAGDGTTSYAVISGNDVPAIHKIEGTGGANTVTPLIETTQLQGLTGRDDYSPAYFDLAGDKIYSAHISTDETYSFANVGINGVAIEGSNASLDAFIGGTGPGVFFGGTDASTEITYFYETDTDSIIANPSTNVFSTVVTDTDLAALTGDDTITGLTAANGVLYFGNANASGGTALDEGIYAWDIGTGTGSTLVTEAQADAVLGGSNGINPSNTGFFAAPDGKVYLFDSAYDAILSFDPANAPGTLEVVLSQAQLVAGPANSGVGTGTAAVNVTDLGWVDGQLAFLVGSSSSTNGAVAGIYALPEPATAALLGLGALAMLRRRSA